MPKFLMTETIHSEKVVTARLGQTGAGNGFNDNDVGKAVKMTADSRYELCALGDPIEGIVSSVNVGTFDGYAIGGVVSKGYKEVTFEGSQAAGTGALAVGTYVVVGTVVARNTALTAPLQVRSATDQAAAKAAPFKARIVSLGSAGTGAVGTTGLIELL
jgi:hypothetical protein